MYTVNKRQKRKRARERIRQDISLSPMVITMIIISIYELVCNGENEILVKNIEEIIPCPKCECELEYRDSRPRILRRYGGDKYFLIIRRLKCMGCSCVHTELPDCLAPYKHYEIEVIENVIDEMITAENLEEDYPCESTMSRWKNWISKNTSNINGHMKSLGYRVLDLGIELLRATSSILELLQNEGEGWLGIILRVIYNSGHFLPA